MRIVILGTGTNVGKTYVTACVARSLRRVTSVLALKPIESGASPEQLGDAGAIALAAGHEAKLSPWRLRRAVSPHLAARDEGIDLHSARTAEWVRLQQEATPARVALVETAGGAFSPLGVGDTNVELALALEPALWLLVAPDALGVLHDVTSTLRALPRLPDAVVLSTARAADESTGTNAAELSRLGICEVLAVVGPGATGCPEVVQWLVDHPTYKSAPT
jgi:dethiobiotin synthetase